MDERDDTRMAASNACAHLSSRGTRVTPYFAIYSFDRRPTTADEIAQLWQARMLLSGELAMPPDPNPEFFAIDNVIDRPRWMSQFPIGGPAFLSIGLLLNAAWLLNPILTALTAVNVYRFVQRAYGDAGRGPPRPYLCESEVVLMAPRYEPHAHVGSSRWRSRPCRFGSRRRTRRNSAGRRPSSASPLARRSRCGRSMDSSRGS